MKKNLLYVLILLISSSIVSNAQDCISNFSIETQCIDAFNFTASITFNHTLEDSDWVSVVDDNGFNYGYFNPNAQPIIFDVLLPNSFMNEMNFIFTSMDDPSCTAQSPTTFVSCNTCDLAASTLSAECVEGTENYLVNIVLINNGTMPASYYLVEHNASGEQYGPFTSAAAGEYQTIELELPISLQGDFSIFDDTNLCRAIISTSNQCAPVSICSISNVTFETECLDTEKIKAFIAFDYESISGDWVNIKDSNGVNYGQFKASDQPLDVEVTLSNTPMNELGFSVESTQDLTCFSASENKIVSCYECEIQAKILSTECIPGTDNYRLTLEAVSMGSSTVENFKLIHAETGRFMGLFNNYAPSNPRLIALSISTDLQGSFIVSDANDLCEQSVDVQVDCSMPLCYFSDISFKTECIDGNNFTADIEFDYEENATDMVSVKDVHGNDYGVFDASQQPLSVNVSLQDTDSREFGFILTSIQDMDCVEESALQTIECETCDIEASTISTECIPNREEYKLTLEVKNSGSSNMEGYKLFHTATNQFIGLFNNFDPSTSRTIIVTLSIDLQGSFTITDETGNCETTTDVQVDCNNPFCYLTNITFETECVDANNFTANIEFDYESEVTDMVTVKDNHGNNYGVFDASQQPLNIDVSLQDSDSREFGFILTSVEEIECSGESALQTIDCIDCELIAEVKHYECENNGETYHMAIKVTNNGDTQGAKYVVTHSATGRFIGTYSHYGSSNIRLIDFYNPIDIQGEFSVSIEGTNCATALNINVDCTPIEPCLLSITSLEYECLEQDQYQVILKYDYAGITGDMVKISDGKGNLFGLYNVNDQPVILKIDDTNLTSANNFEVSINNPNDDSCLASSEALTIECESSIPCEVKFIEIASTECNADETFNLVAEYSMANSDDEYVSVRFNGGIAELYNNTGVINIDKITSRDNSDYNTIEICSTMDSECCKTIEFLTPNCISDEEECALSITNVSYECEIEMSNYISLLLEVDGNNSNEFIIKVNGVQTGSGNLTETVTVIGPIPSNDDGTYLIEVTDANAAECIASFELHQAFCESDLNRCIFKNIDINNLECISEDEYEMILDFEFESDEDVKFTCAVNGEMMVNSSTSLLPLKMSGMVSGNSSAMDVITICVEEIGEECCVDFSYEKPYCLYNSTVDNSLIDGVRISPNPATEFVNISGIPQDIIGLNILDNMGRKIKDLVNDQSLSVDVSNFQSGLYTIQFFTADNRVMSKRFMKL